MPANKALIFPQWDGAKWAERVFTATVNGILGFDGDGLPVSLDAESALAALEIGDNPLTVKDWLEVKGNETGRGFFRWADRAISIQANIDPTNAIQNEAYYSWVLSMGDNGEEAFSNPNEFGIYSNTLGADPTSPTMAPLLKIMGNGQVKFGNLDGTTEDNAAAFQIKAGNFIFADDTGTGLSFAGGNTYGVPLIAAAQFNVADTSLLMMPAGNLVIGLKDGSFVDDATNKLQVNGGIFGSGITLDDGAGGVIVGNNIFGITFGDAMTPALVNFGYDPANPGAFIYNGTSSNILRVLDDGSLSYNGDVNFIGGVLSGDGTGLNFSPYTAGVIVPDGFLTLKAADGTPYKVPCVAA